MIGQSVFVSAQANPFTYQVAAVTVEQDPANIEYINVTFRLIGTASKDSSFSDPNNGYATWIGTADYRVAKGSTVYDVFVQAVADAQLDQRGASSNYVSGVKSPDGYWLSAPDIGEVTDPGVVIPEPPDDPATPSDPPNSGGSAAAPEILPEPDVSNVINATSQTIEGMTAVTVSDTQVAEALKNTVEALRQRGEGAIGEVRVNVDTADATSVQIGFISSALKDVSAQPDVVMTIETGVATLTLDSAALALISSELGDDAKIEISVSRMAEESLSDTCRCIRHRLVLLSGEIRFRKRPNERRGCR